jgi:hypothetical protein
LLIINDLNRLLWLFFEKNSISALSGWAKESSRSEKWVGLEGLSLIDFGDRFDARVFEPETIVLLEREIIGKVARIF